MVLIGLATLVQARHLLSALALAVALLATVAGCTTYVFMPVEVTYEKVSPPYVVSIVNETGNASDIRPTTAGTSAGYAATPVPPGGTFKAILQLRSFTVGAGSTVRGAQVLDNPYFEQAGADKVEMRLVQGDPYSIFFAIQDPSGSCNNNIFKYTVRDTGWQVSSPFGATGCNSSLDGTHAA